MLVEAKKTVSFGSLFGKKTWVEPDKEEPKKKEPKATEQVKKTWVESIDIEDVPWQGQIKRYDHAVLTQWEVPFYHWIKVLFIRVV